MKFRLAVACLLAALLPALAPAAGPLLETSPHGILVDRVLPLAHLEDLDGSKDAPAAGLVRWRQALHELRRAAEPGLDLGWPAPRDVQAAGLAAVRRQDVPLALIHARYDRMTDGDKTAPAEVLALGALRDAVHDGADVRFSVAPEHLLTHGTVPIVGLTFDPDDGAGPRPLVPGRALAAAYGTTGRKALTLTATLEDGRVLCARADLDVVRLATPEPDQTLPITATVPYAGTVASGQAYVLLAPGHTGLTNPVVVVEGFDLDNSMDWPVLYDLLNQENLLEDLRAAGFDAVVLDFTEATEPIQRNAFVLTELLAQVGAVLPPGRTLGLVGASMGGLVSRYALAWLETQGQGHAVRTWVSFDSPHLGANIPVGLQHWVGFFAGESAEAAFLLSRLDTPAARQMLIYHHRATGAGTAAADPMRAAWLADLDAAGGWPLLPRTVAVANGSGAGQDQGFAPGAMLIDYTYRSFLVDLDGDVWAVPDGGSPRTVFYGAINQIWPLPDTYLTVGVGGTLPWDGAPGGSRATMAQMDTTPVPYGDIVALHDSHCFIPTVSALALAGVGPFHDVDGDPDLMARTAFDQVHFPATNQEHIALTPENKAWFLAALQDGLSAVDELPAAAGTGPVLLPAAPNPFNPRTEVRFVLAEPGPVTLRVYDVAGRRVRTLLDRQALGAGAHAAPWLGRDDRGRAVASGVYVVRLEAGGTARTGRVVLAK
ncbi:MAG: T9SS type A sorting domain-containing protein [Krumholzibacteria bacterium]|nr:T9SS type A sorting domain-containing protein [Candidatus Krumholzibacteria bacterium]